MIAALCALLAASSLAPGLPARQSAAVTNKPIIIAHRGASGERPEHTLAAYDLAIDQGADFIEPDLVPTKDGVLVARHENEIGGTTDVASHPEFASRRTTKTIDGRDVTGWFTEDFTLAELKTLRARERLPELRRANTAYDGQYDIPTFAEVIALAQRRAKDTGRTIGVYPETKHPSYFASLGLVIEPKLLADLKAAGWDRADAPVFIQSFEVRNLAALHQFTTVRLIQLVDAQGGPVDGTIASYAEMMKPDRLKQVATYAWGIGPNKAMLPGTTLVADAHAAGLKVHPWTYRAERQFLPAGQPDVVSEIRGAIAQGIDGFFTDFPALGRQARDGDK